MVLCFWFLGNISALALLEVQTNRAPENAGRRRITRKTALSLETAEGVENWGILWAKWSLPSQPATDREQRRQTILFVTWGHRERAFGYFSLAMETGSVISHSSTLPASLPSLVVIKR